jgi:hypothetical protein
MEYTMEKQQATAAVDSSSSRRNTIDGYRWN